MKHQARICYPWEQGSIMIMILKGQVANPHDVFRSLSGISSCHPGDNLQALDSNDHLALVSGLSPCLMRHHLKAPRRSFEGCPWPLLYYYTNVFQSHRSRLFKLAAQVQMTPAQTQRPLSSLF